MEIFFVILVAVVGFAIYSGYQQGRAKEAARLAYVESLSKLKEAPTNADLKQRTLQLGREYSNLTRDKKGNTLFDEVALMNDINAACAAASVVATANARTESSVATVEERLQTLVNLKTKGLIDIAEYEKRRSEILGTI